MSDIYDDNLTINPGTGGAVVATDYYSDAHFQVVKVAFGNTGEATRVNSSTGLPVNLVTSGANVNTSITSIDAGLKIGINGNVAVYGVAGATAVGVTASDLDIRSLTAGDPSAGLASGADFVRVVGLSGAWPVGVTATNLGIRALTAGDPTTAGAAGQDTVRIVGYSGGWPIGVTAVDLDIRSLTYGSDSVSVLNTVSVQNGSGSPFSTTITDGFQTRLLRATSLAEPQNTSGGLIALVSSTEDTVRVVGLSGAWPVNTFAHGLTNINNYNTKLPMLVDSTGALAVYLAAGSVGVTANITGLSLMNTTITGVSLAYPTGLVNTIPIVGYTGADAVPVAVTGSVNIMGLGLTHLNNISINTARVLGASGDYVGITGDVLTQVNKMGFATVGANNFLLTSEINSANINTNITAISGNAMNLNGVLTDTNYSNTLRSANGLKVDVQSIAQPTGGTSGRVAAPLTPATQMGASTLQSGIHFKSDLGNSGVVFVGFNNQVTSQIGFPLYAGDQIFIETDNLNKMFVASTVSGSTVYFIGT